MLSFMSPTLRRWLVLGLDAFRFGAAEGSSILARLAMTPTEGLEAITRALGRGIGGWLLVSTADLEARRRHYLERRDSGQQDLGARAHAHHLL